MKSLYNNYSFKNRKIFPVFCLFLFALCFTNTVVAQTDYVLCATEENESLEGENLMTSFCYSASTDLADLNAFDPITVNLFFWEIVQSGDGYTSYPLTVDMVKDVINVLNEDFAFANICFKIDGIEKIFSSKYYGIDRDEDSHSTYSDLRSYANNNGYRSQTSLDVYVANHTIGFSGAAHATTGSMVVGVWNMITKQGLMTHEVGHMLNMRHTHRKWDESNCEHVTRNRFDLNNYNADTKGDYVTDTNAVPDFRREHWYVVKDSLMVEGYTENQAEDMADDIYITHKYLDLTTGEYIGTGTDCDGTGYAITADDVANFMSYSPSDLVNKFTVGQGIRMREALACEAWSYVYEDVVSAKSIDLYTRNSLDDIGLEPDEQTELSSNSPAPPNERRLVWQSSDIWVRNQQDGQLNQEHENPEYDPSIPSYIYVRVRNNSCQTSSGEDELKLYWAKANTSLNWPLHWEGSLYEQGVLMGDQVGTLTIPEIAPGEDIILEFPWNVPDPENYFEISGNENPWHFCLLARIESEDDPMTYSEGPLIAENVTNNNNIAWKNTSVVDLVPDSEKKTLVGVGNPLETPRSYTFDFFGETPHIMEEAEIRIELSENLYNEWVSGGKQQEGIRETHEERVLLITQESAQLKNVLLEPHEIETLSISFNFLTEEVTEADNFTYHITQKDVVENKIIGGEVFEIKKPERSLFYAEATESQSATQGETPETTLSATSIGEPAAYNWYDAEGNYISSGETLTLNSANESEEYKLEVIAEADGYKDYETLTVESPYGIVSISPNPSSSGEVLVEYLVADSENSYISITPLSGVGNNYVLPEDGGETTIDVSGYTTGVYIVTLVTNNEIIDTKNLIIE